MSRKKEEQAKREQEEFEIRRIRLPRGRQTFGLLEQRVGGSRARVRCLDGKTRICRIPGRLKRRLWLRPGDVVIIEPWELDDKRGDVLFKYRPNEVTWLKKNGYLEKEEIEF